MINNNNSEDRKNENEYYIMKVNFKYIIYWLISSLINKAILSLAYIERVINILSIRKIE